MIRVIARPMRL